MTIAFPLSLCMGLLLVIGAAVIVVLRRPPIPRSTAILFLAGAALLALAAGGITVRVPAGHNVFVMVDLSPSTRTAAYRDRAALQSRIDQLLGRTAYQAVDFSDETASRTVYSPPRADAIVLFSDARFERPRSAAPTYVVIDPNLEHPGDAAVTRLESRADAIAVAIRNAGSPRELRVVGAGRGPTTIPSGACR